MECSKALSKSLLEVARSWFKGDCRLDPEGFECRIGALWAKLFLRKGWALTAFRTVWFKDQATFEYYCNDPWWRAHEHHHIVQLDTYFSGSNARYLLAFVWQYVRYRSHDRAPLEIDANRAADSLVATVQFSQSPDPGELNGQNCLK